MVGAIKAVLSFAAAAAAFSFAVAVVIAALLACGVGLIASAASDEAALKPNVLLVLVDDAHPSMVNHIPAIKQKLIQQGTTYQNAVSNYPLCCPGRVALLRGQYAHNHRIGGNDGTRFFRYGYQHSNLATWLNGVGYNTALFGKYLNNYGGNGIPPGWDRWYAWNGPEMGWSSVNDQGKSFALDKREADALTSERALRFLDRTPREKPFFVWAGFGTPHQPFLHAPSTNDRFTGTRVPRTPAFDEADVSDKPPYVRDLPPLLSDQKARLDEDYRDGMRGLLRVDSFLSKAIATLRERRMLGNTYIFFYSDNGTHFGEHRLRHGKVKPYETDINFPLIVRGPGVPEHAMSDNLVANHDFAPTVADLAGASIPTFVDGRSFRALLDNPHSPAWPRQRVLVERSAGIPWNAIRSESSLYVEYGRGWKEYYDLDSDPHQLRNIPSLAPANAPAILADLRVCEGAECRRLEE